MKSVLTKISSLKANPDNPRLIKDDKFQKLVKSIKDFPQMLEIWPVVVNDSMMVLGGNMRLKAALEAGLKEIPVIKASQLTEEQQKEFIIKDNVGFGEWDWDTIANEWDVDQVTEWGLDIPDFALKQEATEDDYEIPDEIETDIILGDLFEIGEHRLLCGDSTDSDLVSILMKGEKADMIFTDPPYGVDHKGINNDGRVGLKELLEGAFSNYKINSKSGGSVYCCHSDKCSDIFNEVFRSYCHFSCQIIWVKDSLVMSRGDYHSKHEPIFYGWIEGGSHKFEGDRKQTSVWEFERPKRSEGHSTMKPVLLVAKAIQNSSKSDDLIFDLFLGSGTTMVASHQLNRKCYGMEIDPKYCQVIVDRMLKLDPSLQIKKNGQLIRNILENVSKSEVIKKPPTGSKGRGKKPEREASKAA
jgi:DNA modification methylase